MNIDIGEYRRLTSKQREWLEWLLGDGKGWMTIHINAPNNYQRLKWTYESGTYDEVTKELLNFLLNRFNENEQAKKDWRHSQFWKIV